jgi:predicted nucleic acid-binding protein
LRELKVSGRLAVDTNAVIAYREGVLTVCTLIESADFLIPIDEAIAARYATVRLELKKTGHPIPENDIWVAAACLELGVPLLSRDGHFDYVRGLEVINWER